MDSMMMEKQARPRGRTIPWFYLIYVICVALSLVGIFIARGVVQDRLAEYEDAQPKYVAEKVFETYFAPINYDKLLAEARYDAGFATDQAVREYLETEIGGAELTWSVGSAGGQADVKYIVKAGRKQIGSIGLVTAPVTTKHGFRTYDLSYVELNLRPEAIPGGVLTFAAPADYIVTLDGVELTAEQRTDSYLDPNTLKHYPDGVSGIEYAVYTLPDLKELPREISVKNPLGGEAEVSFDRETSTYLAGPAYSQELADEHSQFVIDAVTGYAAYMNRVPDYTLSVLGRYFDQSSALYNAIRLSGWDIYIVPASECTVSDLEIGEFYAHSEDVFSCHISFIQVAHRAYQQNMDSIDMYVFLHRTSSGWRIYEWYNNE